VTKIAPRWKVLSMSDSSVTLSPVKLIEDAGVWFSPIYRLLGLWLIGLKATETEFNVLLLKSATVSTGLLVSGAMYV